MAEVAPGTSKVFVRYRNTKPSVDEMREIFSKHGTITDVKLYAKFCFIEYDSEAAAEVAVAAENGTLFKDVKLEVETVVRNVLKRKPDESDAEASAQLTKVAASKPEEAPAAAGSAVKKLKQDVLPAAAITKEALHYDSSANGTAVVKTSTAAGSTQDDKKRQTQAGMSKDASKSNEASHLGLELPLLGRNQRRKARKHKHKASIAGEKAVQQSTSPQVAVSKPEEVPLPSWSGQKLREYNTKLKSKDEYVALCSELQRCADEKLSRDRAHRSSSTARTLSDQPSYSYGPTPAHPDYVPPKSLPAVISQQYYSTANNWSGFQPVDSQTYTTAYPHADPRGYSSNYTAECSPVNTSTPGTSSYYSGHDKTDVCNYVGQEKTDVRNYSGQEKTDVRNYSSQEKTDARNYSGQEKTDVRNYSGQEKTDVRNYIEQVRADVLNHSGQEKADVRNYTGQEKSDVRNYSGHDKTDVPNLKQTDQSGLTQGYRPLNDPRMSQEGYSMRGDPAGLGKADRLLLPDISNYSSLPSVAKSSATSDLKPRNPRDPGYESTLESYRTLLSRGTTSAAQVINNVAESLGRVTSVAENQSREKSDSAIELSGTCELIITEPKLRQYGLKVASKIHSTGLKVEICNLPPGMTVIEEVEDALVRGLLFAVVITERHVEHNSVTVDVLHGIVEEHRNMILDDAVRLIANSYQDYMAAKRASAKPSAVPEAPKIAPKDIACVVPDDRTQVLISALARNQQLTYEELEEIIVYLRKRQEILRKASGHQGSLSRHSTSLQDEESVDVKLQRKLEATIFSILKGETLPPQQATSTKPTQQLGSYLPPAEHYVESGKTSASGDYRRY